MVSTCIAPPKITIASKKKKKKKRKCKISSMELTGRKKSFLLHSVIRAPGIHTIPCHFPK